VDFRVNVFGKIDNFQPWWIMKWFNEKSKWKLRPYSCSCYSFQNGNKWIYADILVMHIHEEKMIEKCEHYIHNESLNPVDFKDIRDEVILVELMDNEFYKAISKIAQLEYNVRIIQEEDWPENYEIHKDCTVINKYFPIEMLEEPIEIDTRNAIISLRQDVEKF
jgi:hypothetical protein